MAIQVKSHPDNPELDRIVAAIDRGDKETAVALCRQAVQESEEMVLRIRNEEVANAAEIVVRPASNG